MYKSVTLLYKLVANASLGFVYFGYSVGYLNPALATVDVVFGITENVDYYNGLLSAVLTIGAAVGVLLMPQILSLVSRRVALIFLDVFGILGYGIQLAGNWNCLVFGRFLAGIVLGLNSALVQLFFMKVPVYVNEFSPPELQGALGSIMTMSGSSGLFLSFFIGLWYGQNPTVEDSYWKVGFAFPLLICSVRTFNLLYNFQLDSPTYYLTMNDNEKATESIKFIYQEQYISEVLQNGRMMAKSNQEQAKETYFDLFKGRLFKNFIRISVLSIIGQLLGINAVIFYSTSIFNELTDNDVKKSNILNLFVPLLGILGAYLMGLIIGKMSRKNFFLLGCVTCVLVEVPLAIMTSQEVQPAVLVVLFIFLFIFLFSATIGPGYWVVLPEMVSPKGVCLATCINWLATAVVGQLFPILVSTFSISTCFYIFSFSGTLGALYLYYEFNPDQKTEISEIQTELRILEK